MNRPMLPSGRQSGTLLHEVQEMRRLMRSLLTLLPYEEQRCDLLLREVDVAKSRLHLLESRRQAAERTVERYKASMVLQCARMQQLCASQKSTNSIILSGNSNDTGLTLPQNTQGREAFSGNGNGRVQSQCTHVNLMEEIPRSFWPQLHALLDREPFLKWSELVTKVSESSQDVALRKVMQAACPHHGGQFVNFWRKNRSAKAAPGRKSSSEPPNSVPPAYWPALHKVLERHPAVGWSKLRRIANREMRDNVSLNVALRCIRFCQGRKFIDRWRQNNGLPKLRAPDRLKDASTCHSNLCDSNPVAADALEGIPAIDGINLGELAPGMVELVEATEPLISMQGNTEESRSGSTDEHITQADLAINTFLSDGTFQFCDPVESNLDAGNSNSTANQASANSNIIDFDMSWLDALN